MSNGAADDTVVSEAAAWLADYLQMHKVAESQEVKRAGREVGHKEDSLKKARHEIKAPVAPFGFPRRTAWCEPGLAPHEIRDRVKSLEPAEPSEAQEQLPGVSSPQSEPVGASGRRTEQTGASSHRQPERQSEQGVPSP